MTNTVSTDQIIHCDAHTYGAHTDTQIVPRSSGRPRHVLAASFPLSAPEDTPFLQPPPQRSCNLSPSKLQSCSALCGTAPPTMHGARATCRRQPRTAVELAVLTRHQSTTCTSRRSCADIMRLPAWHAAAIGELARSMPQLLTIELAARIHAHARSVGLAGHEAPLAGAQDQPQRLQEAHLSQAALDGVLL